MKTKLLLAFVCLCSSIITAYTQQIPYDFTVLQEDYERLGAPLTFHTDAVWDDPTFTAEIGFDFVYDTTTYTTLLMNDNLLGGMLYFQGDSLPEHLLIAYLSDIIDPGYLDDKSLGYIASKTVGEPGSRIFKMEWNNVGFYNEIEYNMTSNNLVNFQMWLYEGSNAIEFRYGPNTIKQSTVHDIGGPLSGIGFDLNPDTGTPILLATIGGDPANPQVQVIENVSMQPTPLLGEPVSGTVYRFASTYVSTKDIPQLKSKIDLYPTLVENQLYLNIDFAADETLDLAILDVLGRNWANSAPLQSSQTLDLSHLPNGYYFVNIRSKDAVWTKKIVKQ